ncbi:hypothetical protein [Gordonia terrae]|uniref:hypothetical protein n=1 Tax=Gordonia terrae TaxID=2055 RepID=UPI003F6A9F13
MIVTEIIPSTTREYEVVHMAANTQRAQIRASGREPWIWLVAWPSTRLLEIDARYAVQFYPHMLANLGLGAETSIGSLAQRLCAQCVAHTLSAAGLSDPNHPDLFRKDANT